MKQEWIKEWMSCDLVVITPDTTLPEAHHLMLENQIRRLPVVEDDRLVGMLTLGDVRGAEASSAAALNAWEMNYLLNKLKIKEFMTLDPITISVEATISEAAQVMLSEKISGLPVINDEGKLVGVITESDIFRMVVQDWRNRLDFEMAMATAVAVPLD